MFQQRTALAYSVVAAMGLTAATTMAEDARPSVLLRTATMLAYEAPNGPANKPVGRLTGAGVMDVKPTFRKIQNPDGTFKVRVAALSTVSTQQANNDGSRMQGGLTVADLTTTGLQTVTAMKMLPTLDGERTFMRPVPAFAQQQNFLVLIGASEDNGDNNNPQSVAFIADLDGTLLPIANSTRDTQDKPTNLISLANKQDGQQWGPHSICALGADGAGESFLVGMQRNNQEAYVARVKVEPAGNGQVNVTVPYLKRMVDNARHCRPQVTCPAAGSTDAFVTSVEANDQPADIGIRLVKFNATTGQKIASQLVAHSDPDGENSPNGKRTYAVQNSGMIPLANGLGAISYQMSAKAGKNGGNGNDGHTGGENLSMLATVRLADLSVVKTASRVAPYQRHAFSFATTFGEGDGQPAVAVMGGSSTGTGKGLIQIVSADGTGTPAVNAANVFEVSKYSDVANLPARGKRNPNNQGAGFLNGIGGIENPGYQKTNGFMPEVKTFFLSTLPGYKEVPASNRESLWFSLIPATWDKAIVAVPGPVTENVPPGPSPRVNAPPSTDPATQGGKDPFGNPVGGDPSLSQLDEGGCSTSGSSGGAPAALALLGFVAIAVGARRPRRNS
ncbi:MAG: MYXO-CTERM sorting domain-containing protein [Polyangiaceae bacterium]